MDASLDSAIDRIRQTRSIVASDRAVLVAITGIDGCGKGYIARQIAHGLEAQGLRIATINIDGWLNLPPVRFSPNNPAEHFYHHAFRFEQMFSQLVLPLREGRSLCLEVDFTAETATDYQKYQYEFESIDIILLEGIYLLKRQFQTYYDLSIWIECRFETALQRAIDRAQEGLSPQATVAAYQSIYFPAQAIHFQRDTPRPAATLIINNDLAQ
ncbi:MAG: uridine kinase [Spirulina sp. DLM2.Bin59]|nr:MAG: uridine kinase [Spirulina sp. DLM2.Bin59]